MKSNLLFNLSLSQDIGFNSLFSNTIQSVFFFEWETNTKIVGLYNILIFRFYDGNLENINLICGI
jgi:hypothetical protein